ncbi:(3R)-hydroxymyristoyl-(Acyl-carrier-protein) dehydratase [Bacillus mycoides]|uniref:3-hydroxyacyl-ACP dehydratase FabZ family protein n=1 Tax=Bacillus mycoides TaxID=1405 RepID=UPI0001A05142|nr:3-hydroxyacyl-ACP dehydratase FabZ family protein [Bacillus mycoides]EEL05833.1 (3R)-hydroxymyristoyl-(Acyl-carrier-protein) dehydratase [Bacillus cereus BDRD-ST196]AIW84762.1 (3R)-hydroxymyristoyl-(Acyl-carrier-protein) dehydratase [Bacillus mycoides]TKI22189.1 beta-hydroxyacyl-ACP dehydratase [Bacillus mycoides]GAE37968.1 3-hydroxyacyl-[acyl-carrier-protein] dehydratase FabZ [Bacillus mycoides NBRC 101238 = DSM 11821]HDR7596338.1 beta-hydroxyacyl-ACP dehydratase [Bacillus mycoides]
MNIKDTLPHRYPFLMIDKITKITNVKESQSATGYKLITNNEWFINKNQNYMPHMLIVEALAQLSAFVSTGESEGLGFLSSLDGVEFHENAYSGDKLDLHYELTRNRRGFVLGKGIASVNGQSIVTIEKLLIYQAD